VLVDWTESLDGARADPAWSGWSAQQLERWLEKGPGMFIAIVYGEIVY
jgi:hypothetical protein